MRRRPAHLHLGGAGRTTCCGFERWFPGYRAITLSHNYRSRSEILAAAVDCVRHNAHRVDKQLIAVRGPGGRIELRDYTNDHHEAAAITHLVADALRSRLAPAEVLILARSTYLTGPLQQSLAAHGVRYRVLGAPGLFERAAVRDAIAYLALLANRSDGQAFRRAICTPKRGVGDATAEHVVDHARARHRGDLIAACVDAAHIAGIRRARPARRSSSSVGA